MDDQSETYEPNFSDPRVRRRLGLVLEWAEQRLGWNYPEFIDSSELTTVFGNQTSNRLAKWLRHRVLIRAEDSWIPGDQSYAYTISRDGVELIQGKLGLRSRPAP